MSDKVVKTVAMAVSFGPSLGVPSDVLYVQAIVLDREKSGECCTKFCRRWPAKLSQSSARLAAAATVLTTRPEKTLKEKISAGRTQRPTTRETRPRLPRRGGGAGERRICNFPGQIPFPLVPCLSRVCFLASTCRMCLHTAY